jgi:hypothetical protein
MQVPFGSAPRRKTEAGPSTALRRLSTPLKDASLRMTASTFGFTEERFANCQVEGSNLIRWRYK